jgi:hypothetical protein
VPLGVHAPPVAATSNVSGQAAGRTVLQSVESAGVRSQVSLLLHVTTVSQLSTVLVPYSHSRPGGMQG